ncbi:HNH endonuclease [Burkholderia sp. Ax-1719]|uniref:HNH endonuclease n=1 Tax=Burkholderia sp. Ax-1719 TaxID=2608334 RepID=UPI00141D9790|nr:HNH endonuclease [Burkholderia sp. Ax-1719]NIE66932.1 HNH endonuclease [Burkholderia sp. Ax-1719]
MIIEIPDVWTTAEEQHEAYVLKRVSIEMARERKKAYASRALMDFDCFLNAQLKNIVDSKTRDFSTVIDCFDSIFPDGSRKREDANALASRVFNYEKFRDGKHNWDAYALYACSRYFVCPYCHITPVKAANGSMDFRGDLDHFLPRGEFPYLSLSLGNLVPACKDCNFSGAKGTTNPYITPLLNPLKDSNEIVFQLMPKDSSDPTLVAMRGQKADYELRVIAPNGVEAAINSLTTFTLQAKYEIYLPTAHRIARLGLTQAWAQSIDKETGIEMDVEESIGFTWDGDEYKNFPQGKMHRDIFQSSEANAELVAALEKP